MYSNTCNITIGDLPPFTSINGVQIHSTWQKMTDTCTITLPRNIKMGNTPISQLVKRGDYVTVSLGYNGINNTEFIGYVTYVKPTTPIQIECEDSMWLLKKGKVANITWASVTLDQLLQYIYPGSKPWAAGQGGFQYKTFGSVDIGSYSISNNPTPAKCLSDLYKALPPFMSFFRILPGDTTPTLIVGIPYDNASQQTWTYNFNQNVQGNSLEYRTKDDLKISVRVTCQQPNGKKIEYNVGDPDGEQHTLHYYNKPEALLKKLVAADYQKLMYDGYRGTLTGWGWPRTNQGDIADLQGSNEQLIIGQQIDDWTDTYYYIDEVVKTFTMQGYKRECKLGPPAAGITDFEGDDTFTPAAS